MSKAYYFPTTRNRETEQNLLLLQVNQAHLRSLVTKSCRAETPVPEPSLFVLKVLKCVSVQYFSDFSSSIPHLLSFTLTSPCYLLLSGDADLILCSELDCTIYQRWIPVLIISRFARTSIRFSTHSNVIFSPATIVKISLIFHYFMLRYSGKQLFEAPIWTLHHFNVGLSR